MRGSSNGFKTSSPENTPVSKEKLFAVGCWPYLPVRASHAVVRNGASSKTSENSRQGGSGMKGFETERLQRAPQRGETAK